MNEILERTHSVAQLRDTASQSFTNEVEDSYCSYE